jgi:UDP-N-acetylmuramyl pentapeptide synthase
MPASRAIACDATHDVLTRLDDLLKPGDVLLFKASRALALEQIVSQLQVRRAEMVESKSADALVA